MLRVLLLDLDASPTSAAAAAGGPPPHLTDALDALPRFRTADGDLLAWAVVTQDARTLDVADGSAYHRALEHLGLHAPLEDCVVIADRRDRLDVCRTLGMTAVQFARTPAAQTAQPSAAQSSAAQSSTPRFTDWLDALLLVRALVAPRQRETAKVALAPWFSARGAHLVSVGEDVDAEAATVVLRTLTAGEVPGHTTTTSRVRFDHDGHVLSVTPVDPGAAGASGTVTETVGDTVADTLEATPEAGDEQSRATEAAEAAVLRASLRDSGALTTSDAPVRPGATHTESIDDTGALVVRRTRYSAI